MGATHVFDRCDFQTYIMGLRDEPTSIVSATETITADEIRNAIDGMDATGQVYELRLSRDGLRVSPNTNTVDVDSFYPNLIDSIETSRYINNDINTTRNYARDIERDKIIEILKREKNVNTRKCMYVEDLVKELTEILEVRL